MPLLCLWLYQYAYVSLAALQKRNAALEICLCNNMLFRYLFPI